MSSWIDHVCAFKAKFGFIIPAGSTPQFHRIPSCPDERENDDCDIQHEENHETMTHLAAQGPPPFERTLSVRASETVKRTATQSRVN